MTRGSELTMYNVTTNDTYIVPAWASLRWVFISIDVAMMLPICAGNALVLAAYRTNAKLQKTSNMMLVNLSCADLWTGVLVIPWICVDYYYTSGRSQGKISCVAFFVMCHIPLGVSGLTMLAVAILRFLAVLHPLKHKALVTKSRIRLLIVGLWCYMTVLVVAFVVFGNNYDDSGGYCNFFSVLPISYVVTVAGHMGLVGTAAAIMYLYIGIKVVQRGKMVRQMSHGEWGSKNKINHEVNSSPGRDKKLLTRSPSAVSNISFPDSSSMKDDTVSVSTSGDKTFNINGTPSKSELALYNFIKDGKLKSKSSDVKSKAARINHHYKTIKMLSTVLACFYICWVPFMTKMIISMIIEDQDWLGIFEEFAACALYLNSFLNPCIYAGMNISFRHAFLNVLHIRIKKDPKAIKTIDSIKHSSTV